MTVAANSSASYAFPFIGVASTDISVLYTPINGSVTTVSPTAYTVTLNAPLTGAIWGVGGSVNPVTPSNYASGTRWIRIACVAGIMKARALPYTASTANTGHTACKPVIV